MINVIENLSAGDFFTVPVARDLDSPVYLAEQVTTVDGQTRVTYTMSSDMGVRNTFVKPRLSTVHILEV